MNEFNNVDEEQTLLPEDLIAAIQRARSRTASPAMVERLTTKVVELDKSRTTLRKIEIAKPQFGRWVTSAAAAVSMAVVLIGAGYLASRNSEEVNHGPVSENGGRTTAARYSSVKQVPLVLVGFRTIADDMDRADAKAEEISASLKSAILRREIQDTLDEYYDWSIKE